MEVDMKKTIVYLIAIICAVNCAPTKAQYFSAMSNMFIFDTKVPYISNWCPEAGTVYLPGQEVYLDYYLSEGNLTSLQLGFSSEINGEITILGNLPPEGQATITIPDVVTSYGKLYIIAHDSFGHVNNYEVPSDGYLTIGVGVQPVSLSPGWRGISSYYVPMDSQVGNMFGDNLDDIVIIQDLQNVFWPGGNLYSLEEWDVMQGYLIKTLNPFSMNFEGSTPQCNEWASIDEGWDIIPIIADCDIDAQNFMSWYLWSSVIIKEAAGWRVLWPEHGINSLQVLERGKAYLVFSWMANNDFWFGPCWEDEKTAFNISPDIPENWNQPVSTAFSHVFAIPEDVLAASGLEADFTLGAFSSEGLCTGVAPAGTFHITAFSDDPTTEEVDGMIAGEPVYFRAYDPVKKEEIVLMPVFDDPMEGIFTENGISVIKSLSAEAAGVYETAGCQINFYPNPADDLITVSSDCGGAYQITVTDVRGISLLTREGRGKSSINISHLPQGVYLIEISNNERSITRKLLKQ
jgi:hypothetical protein